MGKLPITLVPIRSTPGWRFVRLVRSGDRFSLRTFWSLSPIDLATKTLFGINEQTDDLYECAAIRIGDQFENAFARVDTERAERRRRKVSFPVI